MTSALGGFLDGEEGDITYPVPVFPIEHPRGLVLVDTGLHPKRGAAFVGDVGAGPVRAGDGAGDVVDAEVVATELVVTESVRSPAGRFRS